MNIVPRWQGEISRVLNRRILAQGDRSDQVIWKIRAEQQKQQKPKTKTKEVALSYLATVMRKVLGWFFQPTFIAECPKKRAAVSPHVPRIPFDLAFLAECNGVEVAQFRGRDCCRISVLLPWYETIGYANCGNDWISTCVTFRIFPLIRHLHSICACFMRWRCRRRQSACISATGQFSTLSRVSIILLRMSHGCSTFIFFNDYRF